MVPTRTSKFDPQSFFIFLDYSENHPPHLSSHNIPITLVNPDTMSFQHAGSLILPDPFPISPPPTAKTLVTDSSTSDENHHDHDHSPIEISASISPSLLLLPPPQTFSKIRITSLLTWKKYFHPKRGTMRGLKGRDVGWVIVDVRYVTANDEYDDDDDEVEVEEGKEGRGVFKRGRLLKPDHHNHQTTTTHHQPILLPNVWKLTILGAEFVENTNGRAEALSEVIEACGKREGWEAEEGGVGVGVGEGKGNGGGNGVLDVEW